MQDQILTAINLRPGVLREQTPLAAEGYWTDADKIRFRYGKPELIGGWRNVTTSAATSALLGQPRVIETVRSLDGARAAVIGTHVGLYASNLSTYHNITPLVTTVALSNVFNTSIGSAGVLVTATAHGLTNESVVGFTSANSSIGGTILINSNVSTTTLYQVSIVNANVFEVLTGTTAAATSSGTGGNATLFSYYAAGLSSNELTGGWGTGTWGSGFWGTTSSLSYLDSMRHWSLDLWGTDVMAVPGGGPLFRWNLGDGISSRAVIVTAAPSINQIVRVASEARHVVLYGTHDAGGTYDPLLIRWCSQEDYDDWTPTLTNTAGDIRLSSRGSKIINVTKISDKTAVLTDSDMYLQSYIGSNDVFGFIRVGEGCGAIGQNAAVEYRGILYWMSNNGQFYKYDGRIQPLDCSVQRFVFDNLLLLQGDKVAAGANSEFDEIIWFYPSMDSPDGENDRYVIYNAVENHWTIGALARTAWRDRNTYDNPLATGVEGAGTYYHEDGYTDDGVGISAYLQSAYFKLKDGDDIIFSNKFSPDFSNIDDGLPYVGVLQILLQARKYPGGDVITRGPYNLTGTTKKVSTRIRGRELAIRLDNNSLDLPWRMGNFRMALEVDGKR